MVTVKAEYRTDFVAPSPIKREARIGRPTVSIVCIARKDWPGAIRNASERSPWSEYFGAELVIVTAARRDSQGTASGAATPVLVSAPADATDAQMRAMGLRAATGDVVLFVDHPATADDSWMEHLSNTRTPRAEPGVFDVPADHLSF